ncbi:MAG: hypothetical protein Q9174_004081 [Haloplaca sp. 1 TL-2023]
MSAPPEEWMLWAIRIRNSVKAQINEAIEALPSRYPQLDNDTGETNSLQKNIDRQVESAAASFDERLTNESRKWQAATLPLADRLEQINSSFSQFSQFQEATQKTIADQQQELSRITVQLADLIDKTGMKDQGKRVSTSFSEATTTTDGEDRAGTPPQSQPTIAQQSPLISQNKATYEEYLDIGEHFVQAAKEKAEADAVKAFVQGISQPFRRKPVIDTLEAKGWTWENARDEIRRIIDEGKRRRGGRRTVGKHMS